MPYNNQSDLERRFRTTTAYKRSKQYFDINRLNRIQQKQELSRRKPSQYLNETHPIKFEDSFYSSQLKVKERVQTQLTKCSSKFGREDYSMEELHSIEKIRKGKTLDMNKMIARNYYERSNQKEGKTEYHFNNFSPYKLPTKHSIQFEKYFPPCESAKTKALKIKFKACDRCKNRQGADIDSIPSITEPQVGKVRQKMIFDESMFRTLVDFKKYDKEKSERKQQELQELDLDRIRLGQTVSQKNPNLGLIQFYYGDHKWQSSQMDARLMKQNENFLKVYNKMDDKKKDWMTQKKKTDMIQARVSKIIARKNIKDVKGQICDQLYFRRNYL